MELPALFTKNNIIIIVLSIIGLLATSYTMSSKYAGISIFLTTSIICGSFVYYGMTNCVDPYIILFLSIILFMYNSSIIMGWFKIPTELSSQQPQTEQQPPPQEQSKSINYYLFAFSYLIIVGMIIFSIYRINKNSKCFNTFTLKSLGEGNTNSSFSHFTPTLSPSTPADIPSTQAPQQTNIQTSIQPEQPDKFI